MQEFRLKKPELEAEIYYLSFEEGGRKNFVTSGYRGQFYYDECDWDAAQEFIGKAICNPGEKINALIQTASPSQHFGRLYVGKEFEIREGEKIVAKGTITKILDSAFEAEV